MKNLKLAAAAVITLIVSTLSTSCTSDPIEQNSIKKNVIESVKIGNNAQFGRRELFIENDKLLSFNHGTQETKFVYDENNHIIQMITGNTIENISYSNNEINEITNSLPDGGETRTTFEYNNSNNTVTTTTTIYNNFGTITFNAISTYTIIGNNITRYQTDGFDISYQYDNSFNPYSNLKGLKYLVLIFKDKNISNNNLISSSENVLINGNIFQTYNSTYTNSYYNNYIINRKCTSTQGWQTEENYIY